MSTTGIGIVAKQEFRVRLRTRSWRWLLVGWFVIVAGFTVLLRFSMSNTASVSYSSSGAIASEYTGVPMFGGLMLFVLALALLVAPALTAQSINGDRERGTLATVQVTRLSAIEIALGKLVAAWVTMLAFLALTVPMVVWALFEGGVGIGRACVVLMIVALLVGVICAVSQAFSALFARGIIATLASYLLVFALSIGTVVAFGLAESLTEHREPIHQDGGYSMSSRSHPEDVWWLLAPNPFVILADSAPAPPLQRNPFTHHWQPVTANDDPLSSLGQSVRESRLTSDQRSAMYSTSDPYEEQRKGPAVWPYGFAVNLLLGVGSVWISASRLRTPVHKLPRGVRIA